MTNAGLSIIKTFCLPDRCVPVNLLSRRLFLCKKMGTQQIEQWKPIAECNGQYYISDHGRVKSYKYGKERILKPYFVGYGLKYACYSLMNNKVRKIYKIHRLVALAFIPNPDNKPQVNHRDGDKFNNHAGNLEWVTAAENHQHGWDTGLFESKRVALIKAISKPVIDIVSGKKYDSLKLACQENNERYTCHTKRHRTKSKLQRFFYL